MAGATYACARTICTAGACAAGACAAAGAWLPRNIPSSTMNRLYITGFLFSNSCSSTLKRRNSLPRPPNPLLVSPENEGPGLALRGTRSLRTKSIYRGRGSPVCPKMHTIRIVPFRWASDASARRSVRILIFPVPFASGTFSRLNAARVSLQLRRPYRRR